MVRGTLEPFRGAAMRMDALARPTTCLLLLTVVFLALRPTVTRGMGSPPAARDPLPMQSPPTTAPTANATAVAQVKVQAQDRKDLRQQNRIATKTTNDGGRGRVSAQADNRSRSVIAPNTRHQESARIKYVVKTASGVQGGNGAHHIAVPQD